MRYKDDIIIMPSNYINIINDVSVQNNLLSVLYKIIVRRN